MDEAGSAHAGGRRRGADAHDRLRGRPGLRAADGRHPRRLQGSRRLEGGAAAGPCPPRCVVGDLRRSAALRADGKCGHLQSERAARRSEVSPGAGLGGPVARRAFPDARRQRLDHAQPLADGPDRRHHRGPHHRQPLGGAQFLMGNRSVGPPAARARIERGERPGERGGSRGGTPLGAGRACLRLFPAARPRRAEAAPRRYRHRLRQVARADAQSLYGGRRSESGRGAGRDAAEKHAGPGDRYRRAARTARSRAAARRPA